MRRRRSATGRPTVAILPWGNVVEDYIDLLGISLDDYSERLSGGWMFGFVEALSSADVDTVIVCWSRNVREPTRRIHTPTGAVLWFLPQSRLYAMARSRLVDVYAPNLHDALGGSECSLAGAVARTAAPYLTATPWALARVLRQEACSAVLCQEYEEGRFDLCVGLGKLLRIPVFATFQGGDYTRTRIERRLRRTAVRSAAGLVVAAESEAGRVRERYGISLKRLARIANPLDPATVMLRPRAEARQTLGVAANARVAVWVGRVEVLPKGIDILIDAWCAVRTSCAAPATLLMLGAGSGSPWLHQRLDAIGAHDVKWRDEFVLDREVIGTYLSAADVYVLPSRHEGFAVAPLEAMAAGLPVVAADAPGVETLLGCDETAGGIVVPRDDPQAFAAALGRLFDDPELAAELGARAKRRAETEFSLGAIGIQLRRFLIDRDT